VGSETSGGIQSLQKIDGLASAQYRLGKYGEAEELLKKAYDIRVKELSEAHADTLVTLNNLAAAQGRLGKFQDAEDNFKKALTGRDKTLGAKHCDTLITGKSAFPLRGAS
jgi:tetratricopeptide (TPR) repeat protein